jgi:hypothetical protein
MSERIQESAEAVRMARKAVHLGGDDPIALCMGGYALAFVAHEFDDAAAFMDRGHVASSCAERSLRDNPNFLLVICISAASNALAGRLQPAQKVMARALECNPDLRASNLEDLAPFRRAEDLALFAKGLREAGLPE